MRPSFPGRPIVTAILATLIPACNDAPENVKEADLHRELSIQREVLHQTREVLQYTEEQAELERKDVEELLRPGNSENAKSVKHH